MPQNEYIIKLLESAISAVKADTSEIDTDTALTIAGLLARRVLSKEDASKYMNIPYNKFCKLVDEGVLPKGRKRTGWKELCWYSDELDKYKTNYNL